MVGEFGGLTEVVTTGRERTDQGFVPISGELVSMYGDDLDLPIKPRGGRDSEPFAPSETRRDASAKSCLPSQLRRSWLGGRDSNPDNGVQSAVSYR